MVWKDICADTHTEEEIVPAIAETCGWVQEWNKELLRVETSRYMDGCKLRDPIVFPVGCLVSVEEI